MLPIVLLAPFVLVSVVAFAVGRCTWDSCTDVMYAMCVNLLLLMPLAFWGRTGVILCLLLGFAVGLPVVVYLTMFGYLPNRDTIYVIMETKASELGEFISVYGAAPAVAVGAYALLVGGIAWGMLKYTWKDGDAMKRRVVLAGLAVGLLVPLVSAKYRQRAWERNPYVCAVTGFEEYREQRALQRELVSQIASTNTALVRRSADPGREVHVFVVGEAATRWHQGLYGYFRQTNPALSKRDDIFAFENVISRYTHTAKAIPSILLYYPDENLDMEKQTVTAGLTGLLRQASYKTWWFSNQDPAGIYDNIATVIGQSCDVVKFNHASPRHDDALLGMLDEALAATDDKKVIFLHLMGSHSKYAMRYPAHAAIFPIDARIPGKTDRQSAIINHYDNSIAFTDTLVDAVIRRVSKVGGYSTVVYFPDHGQDVCDVSDSYTHTEQFATAPVYEIPFVVWLSPEFRRLRSDVAERMGNWLRRPFMTSSFTGSYADLLGFELPGFPDGRSLFSDAYVARPRMIGSEDYDKDIKPLSVPGGHVIRAVSRVRPDLRARIWAHRVDSLGKLREAMCGFSGVEIDVKYMPETGVFDVGHPPAPSIGLSLSTMLGELAASDLHVWLDVKTLADEEASAACGQLEAQLKAATVDKGRIVVESTSIASLDPFKKAGFSVVWYTPTKFIGALAAQPKEKWRREDEARVRGYEAELARYGIEQVSSPIEATELLRREFPAIKGFYAWGGKAGDGGQLKQTLARLEAAPWLRCLLVKFSSRFDR
ncbi:MAG: phosphoethanolamine transferase [Planctomycetes bacterium]|nr:phosphoethanolamine transferase [Planctomycetota bacterium]